MDVAIDFATNDIALDATGNPYFVTGADAIRQHLFVRIRFFLGEWFLDTREGVPYFEKILVAGPDLTAVEIAFRRTILGTPGIDRITSIELTPNYKARSLALDFVAVTTDGTTIQAADYGVPFIVVES